MRASEFFELPECLKVLESILSADLPPWEWLKRLKDCFALLPHHAHAHVPVGVHCTGEVYLHPTVKLPPYAVIEGPCWIGAHTEVRPNAYLRGNVIIGEHCTIGHSGEFKNCLLMDHVQAPHRPYVGDSILGNRAHLGAGVVLANLRFDQKTIHVRTESGLVDTGLRKFGAILGDRAEVGCNAVLQPGKLMSKGKIILK